MISQHSLKSSMTTIPASISNMHSTPTRLIFWILLSNSCLPLQPRKSYFLAFILNRQIPMHSYIKPATIRDTHSRELSNHKSSAFTAFAAGYLTLMTPFQFYFAVSDLDIILPDSYAISNERLWLHSLPLLHPSFLPHHTTDPAAELSTSQ